MSGKKVSRQVLEGEIANLKHQLSFINQQNEDLIQALTRLDKENHFLKEQFKVGSYPQLTPEDHKKIDSEFYAGVIDIPNLRSLLSGWQIKVNDWKEYQTLIKTKGTILTVVGNYSKGKTFLFELLSGHSTPHGFNVNTQGISIVYLKDKDRKDTVPIIGLDTKGGSLPLDISTLKSKSLDLSLKKSYEPNDRAEEDTLKEILRDHEATEDILQNFIMEIASVIVVMVADLNYDDQKLVNKIKKKFRQDSSKKIIVVHNLYHTHHLVDVDYKIKEFILKAFNLEESFYKDVKPNQNRRYFVETSARGTKIPHIILAKQFSEAGDYYNDVGIKYIKECINTDDNIKSVNIVEDFHRYLQRSLYTYVKTEPTLNPDDIKLMRDEETGQPMKIYMENVGKVQMKAVFADEFGHLHIFKDGFQPNYVLFEENTSDEEKNLCLKIECPESCMKIRSRVIQTTEDFRIQVRGIKESKMFSEQEVLADTRHFGEFFIETDMYKKAKYYFDYQRKPNVEYIDGMAILRWRLLSPEDEEGWSDAQI